jgi:hypothetical protein
VVCRTLASEHVCQMSQVQRQLADAQTWGGKMSKWTSINPSGSSVGCLPSLSAIPGSSTPHRDGNVSPSMTEGLHPCEHLVCVSRQKDGVVEDAVDIHHEVPLALLVQYSTREVLSPGDSRLKRFDADSHASGIRAYRPAGELPPGSR